MPLLFFKKPAVSDLIKATQLREIDVPAYTRANGTYVPAHRKKVHVNPDRPKHDVANGQGSASQREAHRQLNRDPNFANLPKDHRVALILSHATDIQNKRTAAALLSGWRTAARSGRNPTPSQWSAIYRLNNEQRARELKRVETDYGSLDHLRAPPNPNPSKPPVDTGQRQAAPTDDARTQARGKLAETMAKLADLGFRVANGASHWRIHGEGNKSMSIRVKAGITADNKTIYHVSKGGTFNSPMGGNSSPTVDIGKYSIKYSIAEVMLAKVKEIQEQMRHEIPGGEENRVERTAAPGDVNEAPTANVIPTQANDSGPQEGDTKTVDGVTYELRDGRWHRQTPEESSQREPAQPENNQPEHQTAQPDAPARPVPTAQELRDATHMVNMEDGHRKFWKVKVVGSSVYTHHGRIGSEGRVSVRHFDSPDAARTHEAKLIRQKRQHGYEHTGSSSIPHHLAARIAEEYTFTAPQPEAVTEIMEATVAPEADPIPDSVQFAIHAAMTSVPVPSMPRGTMGQIRSGDLRRLQAFADAGNFDGVANFITLRTDLAGRIIDDYRIALMSAAVEARAQAEGITDNGPDDAPIPQPPTITGANPANTALVAANNKVQALYRAAQSDDPVAAINAIPANRGNGYMNKVFDYKQELLRYFGHDNSGAQITENARSTRRARQTPAEAPVAPATQQAAPPRLGANVNVSKNLMYSANPAEKTITELGYVPRPNVPFEWTVKRDGLNVPGIGNVPYPDEAMKALAIRYLSQPGAKQTIAKNICNDPRHKDQLRAAMHPELRTILENHAELQRQAEARAEQERQARQAREAEERRQEMKRLRQAQAKILDKLQALPDIHKPESVVGANIAEWQGDFYEAGKKLGVDEATMKELMGRLVCDYGNNEIFSAKVSSSGSSVSIEFKSNKGTMISRRFSKDLENRGKMYVEHSYFRAADPGHGSGKSLFRTSLGVYKALGLSRVYVHANINVGGYSWFKFGFLPLQDSWDELRRSFLVRTESHFKHGPIDAEAMQRLKNILNDPDPHAGWQLSDFESNGRKIGNEMLAKNGIHWYGNLHLNDNLVDDIALKRNLTYIAEGREI